MELSFRIDEHGSLAAVGPPELKVLADFFESDIQRSAEACRDVLDRIEAVRTGREHEYEGTGNAFILTLTHDTAMIEPEYPDHDTEAPIQMPLDEFENVVHRCLHFLTVVKPSQQ